MLPVTPDQTLRRSGHIPPLLPDKKVHKDKPRSVLKNNTASKIAATKKDGEKVKGNKTTLMDISNGTKDRKQSSKRLEFTTE